MWTRSLFPLALVAALVLASGCSSSAPETPVPNAPTTAQTPPPEAKSPLEQKLDTPASIEAIESPLFEITRFLSEQCGVQIDIDEAALDEIGLGADTPVTMRHENTPLREVLDQLVGELSLQYKLDKDRIVITSKPLN